MAANAPDRLPGEPPLKYSGLANLMPNQSTMTGREFSGEGDGA
jgi:hypothetical protein